MHGSQSQAEQLISLQGTQSQLHMINFLLKLQKTPLELTYNFFHISDLPLGDFFEIKAMFQRAKLSRKLKGTTI